ASNFANVLGASSRERRWLTTWLGLAAPVMIMSRSLLFQRLSSSRPIEVGALLLKSLDQGTVSLPSLSDGSMPFGSLSGQTPMIPTRPSGLISSALASVTQSGSSRE